MTENKNRGWQRVLLLVLPYFIIVGGFQWLGYYIVRRKFEYTAIPFQLSLEHLITQTCTLVGTFLLLWLFMRFIDKRPFSELGFYGKNRLLDFGLGILLGAFIMGMAIALLWALGLIEPRGFRFDTLELGVSLLLYSIVSLIEETLTRGYVLRNFTLSFNKYLALGLSAFLFAIMHGFNPNLNEIGLINLFLAGVLLGMSYLFTGNLWFPFGLHFSWNFFQTHVGFNVSGFDSYSIFEFSPHSHYQWNGGSFGFEGSIPAIIFQVIAIIGTWLYFRNREAATKDFGKSPEIG